MLNETECEEIFVLTDECEIPVCSRKIYSRGMCNLHYQRNRILEKGGVTPQNIGHIGGRKCVRNPNGPELTLMVNSIDVLQ